MSQHPTVYSGSSRGTFHAAQGLAAWQAAEHPSWVAVIRTEQDKLLSPFCSRLPLRVSSSHAFSTSCPGPGQFFCHPHVYCNFP